MTIEAILSVLLAFAPHVTDRDEPAEVRRARMRVVALVVAETAKGDPVRAARLIAQGHHESRFARYVGEGRCEDGPKGARCDPDKHGVPRARSYWQTWRVSCAGAWDAPAGSLAELRAAASCTDRLMRAGARRCSLNGFSVDHGAFAGARGGAACTGPWAERRSRTYRAALAKLGGGGRS